MHTHTVHVLGLELSFKSEADPSRIEQAKRLLDERYASLAQHGGVVSKERLLSFLALSLADDIVQMRQERESSQQRMRELLGNLEKAGGIAPL